MALLAGVEIAVGEGVLAAGVLESEIGSVVAAVDTAFVFELATAVGLSWV